MTGSHVYASAAGSYPIVVYAVGPNGTSSASQTTSDLSGADAERPRGHATYADNRIHRHSRRLAMSLNLENVGPLAEDHGVGLR